MRTSSSFSDLARIEALEPRALLAADPVSTDHPLWIVPQGAAVIDGVLDDDAWAGAFRTTRSLAYRSGTAATVYMMYNDQGIYLAADVRDPRLWADGRGGGAGDLWEIETDDSVAFYFDLNNSRDEYLQSADRAFGVSIGSFDDDKNGAGSVRRFKYIQGDGAGGAPSVGWFGDDWGLIQSRGENPEDYYLPTGAAYATALQGTPNDDSDTDTGWSTEIFLPWSALLGSAPTHAQTIAMNFDVILDDSGGTRDLAFRGNDANRFEVPHVIDDHMLGVHSSYHNTNAGVRGPVSYAEVMFVDSRAADAPMPIASLTAANTTGYSTQLTFTSPAGSTSGGGHVASYQVRYSTSPILTQRDWIEAETFDNRYAPRLAGKSETLRLIGLHPGTAYYVAVRPVDGAGNLAPFTTASFTTLTTAQDSSGGLRVVPSPLGRMLVHENGDPFVSVGDHLGVSWAFTRQLYTGDVWDNANSTFHNFSETEPLEGSYVPYFDELQDRGINTMRVYLELQNIHATGNPDIPNGLYWLEHNAGQFNPHMRAFLLNLLREADERGIFLILSPFDSFSYDEAFGIEGPWASAFGGPLTDINNFFQDPAALELAKNRMSRVITWVEQSGLGHRVLGYEMLSEWNSYEWTLNAEGDSSSGREAEFRTRAAWIDALAAHTRARDPYRLVMNSTVVEDPRGPVARSVFLSRNFDLLTPHMYTAGNAEPVNNPDDDRSVLAATEQGALTAHWLNSVYDRRPILDGEWGMTRALWPDDFPRYTDKAYDPAPDPISGTFTLAEDEALFRALLWAGFASGQFGTPLRIATDELSFVTGSHPYGYPLRQGFILTDGMRDAQQTIAAFVANSSIGFDFADYAPDPLVGRLSSTNSSGDSLLLFGAADARQGIIYVHQNGNIRAGDVTDAFLSIAGLQPDSLFDVEFWSVEPGAAEPVALRLAQLSSDGTLSIALPDFATGLVVRLRARESAGQSESVVAVQVGASTLSFHRGLDEQPRAVILNALTGATTLVDIAALTNFRGRARDMTPYTTSDSLVHLAVTDENHHLWLFHGNLTTGAWTAQDLTALIDAPGITGDLTTYQPTWGAIHIAGLDARGHAINYWWAPGLSTWQYSDLTDMFDGPTMQGGLTGYVSSWNGLNLAGLNESGEVIVYWWAPGLAGWETINMTEAFDGPALTGQLDAFVTPWGALNITGLDNTGQARIYWWVPGFDSWRISNLTNAASAPNFASGLSAGVSTDRAINVLGIDDVDHLVMLRFEIGSSAWVSVDVSDQLGAVGAEFPAAPASAGQTLSIAARENGQQARLLLFEYALDTDAWSVTPVTTDAVR